MRSQLIVRERNHGGTAAMWHTSRGDRTLLDSEATLVGSAIDTMIDALLLHVNDDILDEDPEDAAAVDCDSGITVYDSLTAYQRIALLHDVAKYLMTDAYSGPNVSAALEGSVAAIFVEIRDQVAIEISLSAGNPSDSDEPTWREMVLGAYEAVYQCDHDVELPHHCSTDINSWEFLVDGLVDAILWDRDFEMADSFMDADPGISHHRRRLLGINEDYFTTIAPDPRPDEVFQLVSRTRDIVRRKPR